MVNELQLIPYTAKTRNRKQSLRCSLAFSRSRPKGLYYYRPPSPVAIASDAYTGCIRRIGKSPSCRFSWSIFGGMK